MGKLSRTKGREFEQRIARDLRTALPGATVHRSSQADRAYESDVVVSEGSALARSLWLECQDARHPTPLDKLAQAERDLSRPQPYEVFMRLRDRLPVVVWHKIATRDVFVTMRSATWLHLIGGYTSGGWRTTTAGVPITLEWDQLLYVLQTAEPTATSKETSP